MNTDTMIRQCRSNPEYQGIKTTAKGIASEFSLDGPSGVSVDIVEYENGHQRVSFYHNKMGRISRNKADRILGGENYRDVWDT